MKEINGYTRICAVYGNPVEHTLSPVIHNYLAELTEQNLAYIPCRIPQGGIGDAVKGAFAMNLLGVNVTVPYKNDVIPFLKELDPLAEQIGAVNTLVRLEDGYKGYNTDMPGLYRAMCSDGVRPEGENIIILGAGGVARAVALLMAQKAVKQIILMNRTVEKAQKIADEVNEITGEQKVSVLPLAAYGDLPKEKKYLVIQATSVGMHPNTEQTVIEDEAFYKLIHTGYDLVYNPLETKFMKLVKGQGGKSYNGIKMLLYQGIIAYEYWTGCSVSEEQAAMVHKRMLEAMGLA